MCDLPRLPVVCLQRAAVPKRERGSASSRTPLASSNKTQQRRQAEHRYARVHACLGKENLIVLKCVLYRACRRVLTLWVAVYFKHCIIPKR